MIDSEAARAAWEPRRAWLVQRRLDLGMTPIRLARRMGMERSDDLLAWEKEGGRIPTFMWVDRWCTALMADLTITAWESAWTSN